MNRTALIILALCIVAILAGAYLLFAPAQAPMEPQPIGNTLTAGPVPFTVLANGTNAVDAPERKNYRLTSEAELASVWSSVHGKNQQPPTVDFSKEEVLVALDGAHATGGYGVTIKAVVDVGATRSVAIVHTEPEKNCVVTQAKTSPYQFVIVSKTHAETLTHTDETAVVSCK